MEGVVEPFRTAILSRRPNHRRLGPPALRCQTRPRPLPKAAHRPKRRRLGRWPCPRGSLSALVAAPRAPRRHTCGAAQLRPRCASRRIHPRVLFVRAILLGNRVEGGAPAEAGKLAAHPLELHAHCRRHQRRHHRKYGHKLDGAGIHLPAQGVSGARPAAASACTCIGTALGAVILAAERQHRPGPREHGEQHKVPAPGASARPRGAAPCRPPPRTRR